MVPSRVSLSVSADRIAHDALPVGGLISEGRRKEMNRVSEGS